MYLLASYLDCDPNLARNAHVNGKQCWLSEVAKHFFALFL